MMKQAELERIVRFAFYKWQGADFVIIKGLSEVPEELQLKSGAYNVKVTAGDSVSASF